MPSVSLNLLNECRYDGEVVKIGVTRAYQIRHGAGPMVTEDTDMLLKLLPGSSKDENRWQGKVRVGPLDFVALRYAINACGGPSMFDGIAVTWFDQIPIYGSWDTCDSYTGTSGNRFFSSDGEIVVHTSTDNESQLVYQQKLGEALRKCQPVVDTRNISLNTDKASLVSLCGEVIEDKLKVPLAMLSLGPTEDHKICI
jgi:adenylosuccinate synthase